MKVTLVQPRYFNIWEALGLAYIGAYAKKNFPGKLKMNFFQGYFDDDQTIIEGIKDSDVVAFSCTSPAFRHAILLAGEAKKINPVMRTVFGGVHPSAVPEDCIREDVVDHVVVGEGEKAFLRILSGETSPIIQGEKADDFGEFFPDRDLVKNNRTVDLCEQLVGKRITSFQSVRGCPFHCAFCAERTITGIFNRRTNPLRVRDPRHVVEEIMWASRKYSLDYFKFVDATWNVSAEKVIAFCEEKIRQDVRLPWEAAVHASLVEKEMLKAMKAAGCHQINVGCESGSQKILHDMRKGLLVERIRRVFQWGREIGIERRGFFLIGMPNERSEDIMLTEKLVAEIQPDVFGVTILCPYPGTDFYDPSTMKHHDWTLADEYSNPYWETEHFTNSELREQQEYLAKKYSAKLTWHNRVIQGKRGHYAR